MSTDGTADLPSSLPTEMDTENDIVSATLAECERTVAMEIKATEESSGHLGLPYSSCEDLSPIKKEPRRVASELKITSDVPVTDELLRRFTRERDPPRKVTLKNSPVELFAKRNKRKSTDSLSPVLFVVCSTRKTVSQFGEKPPPSPALKTDFLERAEPSSSLAKKKHLFHKKEEHNLPDRIYSLTLNRYNEESCGPFLVNIERFFENDSEVKESLSNVSVLGLAAAIHTG